jgi:hypothetical protein
MKIQRQILLLLLFSPVSFYLQAQTTRVNVRPITKLMMFQKKFDESITLVDKNGQPFKRESDNDDIQGSPYFIDGFRYANVTLSQGVFYENIKVKIDLCHQEAHVIGDDQKEMIVKDGLIGEIVLVDSANGKLVFYKFQTGFPAIDKNGVYNFYEVLSDGNIQLLKFIKKEIIETKDVMSGEVKKEFEQYEDYYTYHDGIINKLKKDKDFILDLMKDEQQKIAEYLKGKKMNYKNVGILTELFDYYNSLKPRPF